MCGDGAFRARNTPESHIVAADEPGRHTLHPAECVSDEGGAQSSGSDAPGIS